MTALALGVTVIGMRWSAAPLVSVALFFGCGGSTPPTTAEPRSAAPMAPAATEVAPPPRDDGRLPLGVRPTRYTLDLTVDPSRKTFAGRTRIGITLAEAARAVVMHGRDLAVQSVVAETSRGSISGKAQSRLAFGATEGPDELVLEFDQPLSAGDVELDLAYEAPFAEQLGGLFRVEEGGASYAFTQFEPIDARRMFPCFDEPAWKTPFQVSVRVPKGNLAFSNASENRRSDDPASGLTTFEFEPSQPLPTYLVALAVGPLEVLQGPKTPIPLRVVSTRGKANLGKLALERAAAYLDLYAKYFEEPYAFGKLDLVAIPHFEAGGMENAGLITFREDLLLVPTEGASLDARRELDDAMGHEIAHQWFGNLVTMRWWDELWLNESFTAWIGTKIADQAQPGAKTGLELVSGKSWSMAQDALPAARPIRSDARSPHEITDYNPLIFGKGAPVIGMVEAWLGPDAFRDGMRRYMKKHRGGNVTSADFYAALTDSSGGRDVGKVVESFVGQSGVPVVSAELECPSSTGADPRGGSAVPFLRLRQEEYRNLDRQEPSKKQWRIPVCVRYDAGNELATQCTLLEGAEGRIDLVPLRDRAPGCPSFFYPNAGEVGYYRFRVTREDVDKLATRGLGRLAESERLGLLGNAWAAVWSGHLSASSYFELLRSYKNESSSVLFGHIFSSLKEASNAVITTASRPAFARLVREILEPAVRRLGWKAKKGEPEDAKITRADVLFGLGTLGRDQAVLAEGKRLAEIWLADPVKADPESAGLALVLAAKQGDAATFDRLVAVLKRPATPDVHRLARSALLAFDTAPLVARTLDLTLDGTLKAQDTRDVLFALLRRRETVEAAHAWVEKHFDALVKASPNVPWALAITPMNMCNAERIRAVEVFLRPRLEKLGRGADLQKSVEAGLRCAALAAKETEPTSAWLAARSKAR